MVNNKNKQLVSIKCPGCHKEIFGNSIKNCKVNLMQHNRSTIHKAILKYKAIMLNKNLEGEK